jgi:hypothetical protein
MKNGAQIPDYPSVYKPRHAVPMDYAVAVKSVIDYCADAIIIHNIECDSALAEEQRKPESF